ncbi:hypothetical protein L1987_00999 [Smallanthus sonchifolius]|uniref:Uncharacterized protein n=1 Tax=Smallanthus sonchifolius TaxID=185202 RepID=A0ACB9K415_9ASTR|nr:hypothetical protein L1987_00999 [Smallanthus sonchifolius]
MALPFHVNVLDHCYVSPAPPDSVIPPISLPLTYFDIPWLSYSPNRTLFFYRMPPPEFTTTILKQSLSLALQHFYPLAGNLSIPLPPAEPRIVYTEGDSVSFTVAESTTNIHHLSGNHPRSMTNLSSLLPELLSPTMSRDTHTPLTLPLLAVQITRFSDSGVSIGLTSQHAAADERTLYEFMKCWASFCKSLLNKDSFFEFKSTPWFDRSVILDPNSLKTTLLKQWWNRSNPPKDPREETDRNIVQSTFFLSSSDISKIKHHIVERCKIVNEDPPINLSLYETGVAYAWICLLKVEESHDAIKACPLYLGYNASGISRLKYDVPLSYFGCCIVFGRVRALESDLLDEDGLVCATKSFDVEIDRLVRDFLEGAERWICEWDELNVRVIGSPKVDFYGIDFGWGKAEKIEKLSGDEHGRVNVISLNGGRDLDGGLEIGVVLSVDKMSTFTSLFHGGLKEL